jgi:hypothetical protein
MTAEYDAFTRYMAQQRKYAALDEQLRMQQQCQQQSGPSLTPSASMYPGSMIDWNSLGGLGGMYCPYPPEQNQQRTSIRVAVW